MRIKLGIIFVFSYLLTFNAESKILISKLALSISAIKVFPEPIPPVRPIENILIR